MDEARHTYDVVEILDGGKVLHLRCPECGKEVARTLPTLGATSSNGYRVLRDEQGRLLQGDFAARHSWAMNIALSEPDIRLGS